MPLSEDDIAKVRVAAAAGVADALGCAVAEVPRRIEELTDRGVRRVIRDKDSALHRGLAAIKQTFTETLRLPWPPKDVLG